MRFSDVSGNGLNTRCGWLGNQCFFKMMDHPSALFPGALESTSRLRWQYTSRPVDNRRSTIYRPTGVPLSKFIGIDFSGGVRPWRPTVSRPSVWLATTLHVGDKLQLEELLPAQELKGIGTPFDRLVKRLVERDLKRQQSMLRFRYRWFICLPVGTLT